MQAIAQSEYNHRSRQTGNRKRKNKQSHQNAPNKKRFHENQSRHGYPKDENWRTNTTGWADHHQQPTARPMPLMSISLAPPQEYQYQVAPVQEEVPKQKTMADMMAMLQSLKSRGLLKPSPPKTEAEIWNQLGSRNQKIRNQSLIDSITTRRPDSCKWCGMKVEDERSKSYKDHMDEHVRQNLKLGSASSAQQPWYPTTFLASAAPPVKLAPLPETSETVQGVISSGSKITKCSVCKEKFEETYDDDDEVWRFKGTIKKLGHVVHLDCASGVTEDMELKHVIKKEEVNNYNIYLD